MMKNNSSLPQKTQLDGIRLARKVEAMDKNTEEALSIHKVDDTPLNAIHVQTYEENMPSK